MTVLLEVEDLRISIPTASGLLTPVRGIELRVHKGETLAIVGESGCGKSLTALSLIGLAPPLAKVEARRLAFQNSSLLGLGEKAWRTLRGMRIAMIFQDPMTSLDPCYTIGDQMVEVMRAHLSIGSNEARQRAVGSLKRVGVPSPEARLGQYPHQLSGGLRQRVMIAMALSCEPQLIIADEPTTALDVTTQVQVLSLLRRLQQESNLAIILITHDLGVVASIAHRVAVMYAGQIVETGTTDAILENPVHPYTEGLLRSLPMHGKNKRDQPLGTIPGIVPAPRGAPTGCLFRDRCPYAREICAAAPVPLLTDAAGHAARCVRPVAERNSESGYAAVEETA